jgi:hypothetical protein
LEEGNGVRLGVLDEFIGKRLQLKEMLSRQSYGGISLERRKNKLLGTCG